MAKEISRTFRPEHRDVLVVIEDDFGVRRQLYVGLREVCRACQRPMPTGADGNVDVDAVVDGVLKEESKAAAKLEKLLKKARIELKENLKREQ